MIKLPVFTKGIKTLAHLKQLIERLEARNCIIDDLEIFQFTGVHCSIHYEKMVGGEHYDELEALMLSCPSAVLNVSCEGHQVVVRIIGEKTDPKKCSEDTLRFEFGDDKGPNGYHRPEKDQEVIDDEDRIWSDGGFVPQFREDKELVRRTHVRAAILLTSMYGRDKCEEVFNLLEKYRKVAGVLSISNGQE